MLNNGIGDEIFSLINNEEIRPTANLIISKTTAYDYLNNSNPNLEKLTTQYYETFSMTGRFTGYFANLTIGDFYNNLSSPHSDPTAILGGLNSTARQEAEKKSQESSSGGGSSQGGSSSGGSGGGSSSGGSSSSSGGGSSGGSSSSGSSGSSSQTINPTDSAQNSENQDDVITNPEDLVAGTSSIVGDRGTENFGLAVFKEDKLCGELTAVESICHLLILNEVDSCIISIDNPVSSKGVQEEQQEQDKEKMELQIFPRKKTKVDVSFENDTPHISIDVKLDADIMTLDKDINYETEEVLSKISEATKNYLTTQFNDYLNKVTKEYDVDIDEFSLKAPAHFSTISEWESFNWNENFKNAEFDVNIDINVLSTISISKT